MLLTHRLLCLLFCFLVLSGCGLKRAPSPNMYGGNFNGISFEVWGFGEQSTHVVAEDEAVVTNGSNRLNIKSGRIVANGRDYGPVKKGETVVLDADGRVTVNGVQRTPSD